MFTPDHETQEAHVSTTTSPTNQAASAVRPLFAAEMRAAFRSLR